MSKRLSAQQRKERKRQRLRDVKRGYVDPKTLQEKAIWWEATCKRKIKAIQTLHRNAAINKPSKLAGKVIAVNPPKSQVRHAPGK